MRPRPYTAEQVVREIRASAWAMGFGQERARAKGNPSFRTDAHTLRALARTMPGPVNMAREIAWAILYRAAYLGTLPSADQCAAWREAEREEVTP